MTEADWQTSPDPPQLLMHLRGKAGERKSRLFAVACCRRIWDPIVDERSRRAVGIAGRMADGRVAPDEAVEASNQARAAMGARSAGSGAAAYAVAHPASTPAPPYDPYSHALWAALAAAQSLRLAHPKSRRGAVGTREEQHQAALARDIFGNPFRAVTVAATWLPSDVAALARGVYSGAAFGRLPTLADALEDAGCDDPDLLSHCRGPGPHSRGCRALDALLGKA